MNRLDPDLPVLDSDRIRRRWAARLGRLPYPLWRPFVHAAHWLAILGVLRRGEPAILVRPFTTTWLRRAVLRRARIPAHLVALTATPEEARDGQRARRRTVSDAAMLRHERAWAASLPRLAEEGWATVTTLSRADADAAAARAAPPPVARTRQAGSGGAPAPRPVLG